MFNNRTHGYISCLRDGSAVSLRVIKPPPAMGYITSSYQKDSARPYMYNHPTKKDLKLVMLSAEESATGRPTVMLRAYLCPAFFYGSVVEPSGYPLSGIAVTTTAV